MSLYPDDLDEFENPSPSTPKDAAGQLRHSTQHAQINDAMEAVQGTLGVSPQGSHPTVGARITANETSYKAVITHAGTSLTLDASHAGCLIEFTSSTAITVTVPSGVFSAGQRADFVCTGTGLATVVQSGGASLLADPSTIARARYVPVSIVALSSTRYLVAGGLT